MSTEFIEKMKEVDEEYDNFILEWGESSPKFREHIDYEFADHPMMHETASACGIQVVEKIQSDEELARIMEGWAEIFSNVAERIRGGTS